MSTLIHLPREGRGTAPEARKEESTGGSVRGFRASSPWRRVASRASLAALLLAAAASRAPGLNPGTALSQYGRDVWDGDSGLPQNSVDAILQTRDGYLWLGTQEGLVRFDGVRFSVFDSRNSPAIRDDWVRSLCEGRDGTLWVGTAEGLLRSRDGRFDGWQPEGDLARGAVVQLLESRDGVLWSVTARGLARLKGHAVRLFGEKDGLSGQVTAVAEDSDGRLWAGGQFGLARLEGERFRPAPPEGENCAAAVTALVRDPRGGLWAGTRTGIFHAGGGRSESRSFPRNGQASVAQVLYVDAEGGVWIGTSSGLLRFADGRFEELTRENGGLSSGDVNAIFEDREGSLWIGTRDGGMNRLKDERIANYSIRQGLPEDHVWSVFEDRDETLWVGTADGSLSRLLRGKSRFEFFASLGARVVAMDQDTTGDIWVGTRGQGLFRVHDGRTVPVGEAEGFAPTFVGAVRADRNGGVWIGTGTAGLFFYRDGMFRRYTQNDGLASNAIFCLYQDRAGDLWVGTWGGGISRLRGDRISNLTTKDGLAHDIVMSVLEDARGDFWFGTRGGLSRWSGGKFTTFRQATGLFHDAVQNVMADDRGYLWMTSNRGIFRVRAEELAEVTAGLGRTLHPIGLTTGNGMRNVECNNGQHGGARGRDGRLWFATLKGLAMADPTRIRLNNVPPQVVIERVLAGRRELDLGEAGSVTVEAPTRDLEFQYTALSFRNPGAIRFRYRLEGFDAGWIEAEGRRTAFYTNLPPGKYTFRVLAGNEDGYWSVGGAKLQATLERSIPETAWFRLLVIAGILLAAWSAHRLRARRLAAGEALRAAVLEAKLSSLQSQLKPHFLFNALNSLLPLVGNEPSRARRMIIRIGDLLRASLMSETSPLVTLERDLLLLGEYLDVERMRFRDRISIEIHADERSRAARVPSFLLQPLVENAIKHAADPVTGRVRIRIAARVDNEALLLEISDDGPGVKPESEKSGGIGLRNIRRRLDLLYPGQHDLELANLPGGGCEVRIRLPLSLEPEADQTDPGLRRVRAGTP